MRSDAGVHVHARRCGARILALFLAASVGIGLTPAGAVAADAHPANSQPAIAAGDWAQYRDGPGHTGYNATETTLSASTVADLSLAWTSTTDLGSASPPVVADGVVYVGTGDQELVRIRRRLRHRRGNLHADLEERG